MTDNWEKVMTTRLPHRAELAKAFLAEREINAVIVNSQSSAYPDYGLGNCDVYVLTEQAIVAKFILEHEATFS